MYQYIKSLSWWFTVLVPLVVGCFLAPLPANAKMIVVLMDGTWNEPDFEEFGQPQGDETNIERLHKYLREGEDQQLLYFSGIGTYGESEGNVIVTRYKKVKDGVFGRGAKEKIDEAYAALEQAFEPGDTIAIFGFSRGAATSRMLARKIDKLGIRGQSVAIRFLGLFDTVAAFGDPDRNWDVSWHTFEIEKDYPDATEKLKIPDNVRRVVHLVSIDEDRVPFTPSLLTLDSTETEADEVWFAGNHGDIGGGWSPEMELDLPHALWHMTLRYMIEQAKLEGIKVEETIVNRKLPSNPTVLGTVHELDSKFQTVLGGRRVREMENFIGSKVHVHESVRTKMTNDDTYDPLPLQSANNIEYVVEP